MLVDESIWSRGVYNPCPVVLSELLTILGQQLAAEHGDILASPLPERLTDLVRRLSPEQTASTIDTAWND